ncbi:hypothetical protein T439DRAFT_382084 [Meredithblackwellia eburnea MCA 4105]
MSATLSSNVCPFSNLTARDSTYSTSSSKCPVTSKVWPIVPSSSKLLASPPSPLAANSKVAIPPPELVYLPPLLSLLPGQSSNTNATPPLEAFSFEKPTVGFTSSRLPLCDDASVALHNALHFFKPTTPEYAYSPYEEAFNWNELILPEELEREWYIVAFRSTRAPDSPSRDLYSADRAAHEEAVTAGGLLAYWYGVPNEFGSNLATCIWMSRKHAVQASSGQKHIEAMRLATAMYANYDLERYVLRKVKGETGVSVERWVEGDVGF